MSRDLSNDPFDERLQALGVPQDALNRLTPKINGLVYWDEDRFIFVEIKEEKENKKEKLK